MERGDVHYMDLQSVSIGDKYNLTRDVLIGLDYIIFRVNGWMDGQVDGGQMDELIGELFDWWMDRDWYVNCLMDKWSKALIV